jgi:hypothetical protein
MIFPDVHARNAESIKSNEATRHRATGAVANMLIQNQAVAP